MYSSNGKQHVVEAAITDTRVENIGSIDWTPIYRPTCFSISREFLQMTRASDVCIIINNLHPDIKQEDLWNYFDQSAVSPDVLKSKPLFVSSHQLNVDYQHLSSSKKNSLRSQKFSFTLTCLNKALKDVVIKRSNGSTTVIVAAKYPAYFWRLKNAQEEKNFFDFSCWERVTEIPLHAETQSNKDPIKAYTNSSTSIRLNSWSVYLIELTLDDDEHKKLSLRLEAATAQKMWHTAVAQVMKASKSKINYEEQYNIEEDFFETIENLEPHVACTIIHNTFKKNPYITNPPEVIPEDHAYLRKVIITPTSVYPLQPVLQKMKHLQYQFKQHANRFLLVKFADEELNSIVPSPYPLQNDLIYNHIFKNNVLKQLKDEYKLYITNGARAFAIMHETGSLEQSEVFFQTSTSTGINTVCEVIEGPCVIFRYSTLSPGNVVLATVVNKPKLKNYTNVLIYSANELTDLPGKCSNDDADEDNFT
ncbi:hypothetical protein CU097_009543 [Rhizopus azygosporus]|uniref:RNA-dependent RNA polymerase n=1 Tax=Rhizopus azygosporus TaxID=86630 RepID=A0A367KEI1_RHIAZ|nr:hypothetical protein CU097_009543 [Rhizopus azygosporus]